MRVLLTMSKSYEKIFENVNSHYKLTPQELLRALLLKEFNRLNPVQTYKSVKQKKPWEEMTSSAYCLLLGGAVEDGNCVFTDGAVTERVSLQFPEEFPVLKV